MNNYVNSAKSDTNSIQVKINKFARNNNHGQSQKKLRRNILVPSPFSFGTMT